MTTGADYARYYQERALLGAAADSQNRGANNLNIKGISVDELVSSVAEHLKLAEGFKDHVYDDYNGKPWAISKVGFPTIGYGHLVKPGEQFTTITEAAAYQLLLNDVVAHLKPIIPYVKVPLTIPQWVVLTSMAFNMGPGIFRTATFVKRINDNSPLGVIEPAFKAYNKGRIKVNGESKLVTIRGLTNRRAKEWAMFVDSVAQGHPQVIVA